MGNFIGGMEDTMVNMSSRKSPNFLGWLYAAGPGPELRRMEIVQGIEGEPELASKWYEEWEWRKTPDTIKEPLDCVMLAADPGRRMIVAVGKGGHFREAPVYAYDIDRVEWRQLPSIPFRGPEGLAVRYKKYEHEYTEEELASLEADTAAGSAPENHDAVVIDQLFTVGGEFTEQADWVPLTEYNYDVNVLYLDDFLKEQRDMAKQTRRQSTAGRKGGNDDDYDVDTSDWRWEPWSKHPLGQVTGTATCYNPADNCLYVHGGLLQFLGGEQWLRGLFRFDLETYTWIKCPESRHAHAFHHPLCVDKRGRIYAVFGGNSTEGSYFERYDPHSQRWDLLPEPFSANHIIMPTAAYMPPATDCNPAKFGTAENPADEGHVVVYGTVLNTVKKGELGVLSVFDVHTDRWVTKCEGIPGDFAKIMGAGSAVYRALTFMPASRTGAMPGMEVCDSHSQQDETRRLMGGD